MDSGRRSGNFRGVRIALIVFQILALIGAVVLLISSIVVIGDVDAHPDQYVDNAKTILIVVVVISVISLLVDIMGLVGSIKENQVLTIIFGVVMALNTIASFATVQIWSAVIYLIVTILAFVFVYLIRKEVVVPTHA